MVVGASCLLIGIIGKSGQFPLHTWLPDAMAGPTPVSALIHAATMVVAGVYLGARVYGVFWSGFKISAGGVNPMALIGGITIIIGAALAFVQDDIKKVLAYSTISQLGYMVMGLGVGAWVGAVFHLFTHAFFKALLFLGAGSVSHSGSHHSFDMKKDMGGLRKYMPITFWTFLIGSAALAGIAPLAGFWSKDEILATAGQCDFEIFAIVGLVGAVLTAAYMTRCVYLTFFGEYRGHGAPARVAEARSPVPLIVLAGFSVFAGLANAAPLGIEKFAEYVEPKFAFPPVIMPDFDFTLAATVVPPRGRRDRHRRVPLVRPQGAPGAQGAHRAQLARKAGYTFLVNKYYLDDLYEGVDRRRHQGPDRPGLVLGQPERHRRRRQRGGPGRPGARAGASTAVDQDVRRRRVQRLAQRDRRAGGLLRGSRPGACSGTRSSCSPRSGSSPSPS